MINILMGECQRRICRKHNSDCVSINPQPPPHPSETTSVIHQRKISARAFIEFEATAVSK